MLQFSAAELVIGAAAGKGEKHHFIPSFYSREWAGPDGRLCEYSRPYNEVKPRWTHPDGTGYVRGLYTVPNNHPYVSEYIERHFFRITDDGAARVAQKLRAGSPIDFLAAAKTLVDHTRVFMRAYYLGSPLEKAYQDKIAAEIANDELCRFVHDLRNYMLHCGAPPLSIWSSLGADRKTQAGVNFIIAPLTEWNGWTAPSKRFLDKQRRDFDVDDVARIYSQKIVSLHVWLDGLLSDCHRSEMSELRALENELASLSKFYRPEADAGAWSNWRDPPKLSGLPWIP